MVSAYDYNLGDFFAGHESDPLRAPSEFVDWRTREPLGHALYERTLCEAPTAHTRLESAQGAREVINMASLDYLGASGNREVAAAQSAALRVWGTGACGVPLLSGMTTLHRQLESTLNGLTQHESTAAHLISEVFARARTR